MRAVSHPVIAGGWSAPAPVPSPYRHTKSRNGCVTCKARRRKCDEVKPSCSQCLRRGVTCGGYNRDLRWKVFGKDDSNAPCKSKRVGPTQTEAESEAQQTHTQTHTVPETMTEGPSSDERPKAAEMRHLEEMVDMFREEPEVQNHPSDQQPNPQPGQQAETEQQQPQQQLMDFDLLFSDILAAVNNDPDTQMQVSNDMLPLTPAMDFSFMPLSDPIDETNPLNNMMNANNLPNAINNLNPNPNPNVHPNTNTNLNSMFSMPLYQQPRLHGDSPEHMALLFHRRVCDVLCIREDAASSNPWRRMVWPMAQDHAVLYHAIAAMTWFQGANRLPALREQGRRHLESSIRQLYGSPSERNGNIRLEVSLAATIVLGFAQTWYHPRSSTAIRHVHSAKGLLKKALIKSGGDNNNNNSNSNNNSNNNKACIRFLANTWIYMDIITRFTCRRVEALDPSLMDACRQLDGRPDGRQDGRADSSSLLNLGLPLPRPPPSIDLPVDPLMGAAASLFPLMGRVADLVRKVHSMSSPSTARSHPSSSSSSSSSSTSSSPPPLSSTTQGHLHLNPPALVAEAVELKMAVERWSPPSALHLHESLHEGLYDLPDAIATSASVSASAADLRQTANAYKWATLLLLYQAVPELPLPQALPLIVARLARKVLVLLATVPLGSRAVLFPVLPLVIAGCEAADPADRDWVRHRWQVLTSGNSSGVVDRCLELTLEVWRRRDRSCSGRHNDESQCIDIDGDQETTQRCTVKSKTHWLSVMRDWGWEVMLG